jgi:predicted Zn finger-like uncharacterized protein
LTVFHISAAELRAADGTVVCGECNATFDALSYLSETPPAEPPASRPAPQPEPEPEPEPEHEYAPPAALPDSDEFDAGELSQARDEEDFLEELESLIGAEEDAPEDELGYLLEPVQELAPRHEPEPEPVPEPEEPLEPDTLADPEPELEPEPEPDDMPETAQRMEPDAEVASRPDAPAAAEIIEEDWEDHVGSETISGWDAEQADPTYDPDSPFELDPDSPFRLDADDMQFGETFGEPFVGADTADDDNAPMTSSVPADEASAASPGDTTAEMAAEPENTATTDTPDTGETGELPEFAARPRRRRRGLALGVTAAVLLVLAGTWAHTQRGTLLRHPAGEAIMGPIYALVGIEAAPRWSPEKFRALKWEAEADPAQPDRLIVAVEFLNSADFAQPYPMLRVVLEDRFGRRVGNQDVAPAQYLEGYSRGRRLPAGGRGRTTIEVPDPGARAEGFRIDFCLESGSGEPACGAETFR